MNLPAFFRSRDVRKAVAQAAMAGAMPIAVRHVSPDFEGPVLAGSGACAACGYVAGLEGGTETCARSRIPAALDALQLAAPSAFVCHMGFACVCAPALPDRASTFVATIGPYCPAEAPQTLESDFRAGLEALTGRRAGILPVALEDIRVASTSSPPALAEWLCWTLASLLDRSETESTASEEAFPGSPDVTVRQGSPRRRAAKRIDDPLGARTIVAALVAGNRTEARTLIRAAISPAPRGRGDKVLAQRARAMALASAIIENAQYARIDAAEYWDRALDALRAPEDTFLDAILEALMDLPKPAAPRAAVALNVNKEERLRSLNQIVETRLADGVTLGEVAKILGKHPTAITHQLKRTFGITFSEYVGRLRVVKAKDLLCRTKLDVHEVGQRVGVPDPSNFGKLFRRFEGMSPTQYRAQYGGGK